jgi:hypothetical protein
VALLGASPAHAFQVSGQSGINASGGAQFKDPDEQAAHIANGGGAELSSSWADRPIAASGPVSGSSARTGLQWSNQWYAPSLIIGDRWNYPPAPLH